MSVIHLLCVSDETDILQSFIRDLKELHPFFPVQGAESPDEAREMIDTLKKQGDQIGIIFCEHHLTDGNGIDLLVEWQNRDYTRDSRKVLITDFIDQEESMRAVNDANLAYYLPKPWKPVKLVLVAKSQVTRYILRKQIDPRPYLQVLDPIIMAEAIRQGLLGDR